MKNRGLWRFGDFSAIEYGGFRRCRLVEGPISPNHSGKMMWGRTSAPGPEVAVLKEPDWRLKDASRRFQRNIMAPSRNQCQASNKQFVYWHGIHGVWTSNQEIFAGNGNRDTTIVINCASGKTPHRIQTYHELAVPEMQKTPNYGNLCAEKWMTTFKTTGFAVPCLSTVHYLYDDHMSLVGMGYTAQPSPSMTKDKWFVLP